MHRRSEVEIAMAQLLPSAEDRLRGRWMDVHASRIGWTALCSLAGPARPALRSPQHVTLASAMQRLSAGPQPQGVQAACPPPDARIGAEIQIGRNGGKGRTSSASSTLQHDDDDYRDDNISVYHPHILVSPSSILTHHHNGKG